MWIKQVLILLQIIKFINGQFKKIPIRRVERFSFKCTSSLMLQEKCEASIGL